VVRDRPRVVWDWSASKGAADRAGERARKALTAAPAAGESFGVGTPGYGSCGPVRRIGMETDMESDRDIIFYHIFTRGFECSQIRVHDGFLYFGNAFGYPLDLEDNIYQFSLLEIYDYKIMERLKY
jgi:hypothetical protein